MTNKDFKISTVSSIIFHLMLVISFGIITSNYIGLISVASIFFVLTFLFSLIQKNIINHYKKLSLYSAILFIVIILAINILGYPIIYTNLNINDFLCKTYVSLESTIFTYVILYGIL